MTSLALNSSPATAQRIKDPASYEIEMAREARKQPRGPKRAAARPTAGTADVAANASREITADFDEIMRRLNSAAEKQGLQISGPVEIPEGELARMRANPDAVRRVWLCEPEEPRSGPCYISFSIHELRDKAGKTRAAYRVWALTGSGDSHMGAAVEKAEAILAVLKPS